MFFDAWFSVGLEWRLHACNNVAKSTLLENPFRDKTLQTGSGTAESVRRVTISYESPPKANISLQCV